MPAQKTEHIRNRRSVRRYLPEPVPEEVVREILDCGRLAPSALNKQPWLLGAVTDPALLKGLADLVEDARFIQQSAVCFAVFTRVREEFYLEDGCAAVMNILYACHAHGLGACWVAGDRQDFAGEARVLLKVPTEYKLVALVPAGYPDKVANPGKRQLDDVMFTDSYVEKGTKTPGSSGSARFSLKGKLRHFVRGLLLKWF